MTPPLLVLHDVGDEAAGEPWRMAAADLPWPTTFVAPDLPGHGDEPAPPGGSYETTDAAVFAVRHLAAIAPDVEPPVVVGVGAHGWAAEVLALGGRAAGLVLVDGLGGPWRDGAATIVDGARWLRAIADDADALDPPPARGLDPRLRHGIPPLANRSVAERAASQLPVPVLVITTPASPLGPAERDDLVTHFQHGAQVVELPDRSPAAVLAEALAWAEDAALDDVDAQASAP